MTITTLNDLTEDSGMYKNKAEFIKDLISIVIKLRKLEQQTITDLEKYKA